MTLMNQNQATVVARSVRVAGTFWRRLKGLMGTDSFPAGQALIIKPCTGVHTFGMKYAIDVLFVDARHRVVKIVAAMGPNQVAVASGASYVVELEAGAVQRSGTAVGDSIEWSE